MVNHPLTPEQLAVIASPLDAKIFLEGHAGAGKTTAGMERLLSLFEAGIPGYQILLLVPQRTLATPYYDALQSPTAAAGGSVTVLTIGGLAKRMVELFWPLISAEAGFAHPNRPPNFLTLETAQYFMARLVRPLLDQGFFESLTIERNRLYSQILDNLNKAAVVGFPHTEISLKLKSAWAGDPGQAHVYEDAQHCADLFRAYCLERNLLDFSLQLEIFLEHLWPAPICRDYLVENYRHMIVDNLEEDVPVTFDLLREWIPELESGLFIYDLEAGYRRFMGADPQTTYQIKEHCDQTVTFFESFSSSEEMLSVGYALAQSLHPEKEPPSLHPSALPLHPSASHYYPQMLDWVVEQIAALVEEGTPPGEIVVLSSFLSDALRFSLAERLDGMGIPTCSHRPSRSLREEPATQALLTLAALAHPQWGLSPSKFDLAYALIQAIEGLDLVRAQLLTEIVYKERDGALTPFDQINPETQERITYQLGNLYQELYRWLNAYTQGAPGELDHFFSRLFGEVLSQPGFGFHVDYDAGEVAANLIESVRKFRWAVGESLEAEGISLGKEYLQMVADGVIAAQYIYSWQTQPEDAVFLAPAYTFLMRNRPVEYQFWLDIGSRGWYERIRQPLTHPYVLSRHWELHRPWTDADEYDASRDSLYRLALGLIRRCRSGIYLGLSQLGEQGYEHKGLLLKIIDRALYSVSSEQ
ncbi:MAG: hypothetical protein FJ010_06285 [Chloroflexi bacterium]|nr:hypothetical protein [Chloroflexota bacterium]